MDYVDLPCKILTKSLSLQSDLVTVIKKVETIQNYITLYSPLYDKVLNMRTCTLFTLKR